MGPRGAVVYQRAIYAVSTDGEREAMHAGLTDRPSGLGEVTDRIPTPMPTFACALGGDDGRTLFVLCAPASRPDEVAGAAAGAIHVVGVDVPHAGRP